MITGGIDWTPVRDSMADQLGGYDGARYMALAFRRDIVDQVPWASVPPGLCVRVVDRRPSYDHPGRLVWYHTLDIPGVGIVEVPAEWRDGPLVGVRSP